MSLRFILGPSGSGKTRYLYEEIIRGSMEDPREMFLLLVPEQYTMQAQKELIELHPRHGLTNVDVLSFNRLAYRVFEDLAVETLTVLDDMGKSMILRKILSAKKKELHYYRRHLGQIGFVDQVKSLLSELYQYGVTPVLLNELEGKAEQPILKEKLKDLSAIFGAFQAYIKDKFTTAEEVLDLCCRELPRWEKLSGSRIYLDGFTGFTPVQYRILEICLADCRQVQAAVTVDTREPVYAEAEKMELFYMSRHMICRLIDGASRAGTVHEPDVVLDGRPPVRFKESPRLAYLESRFDRYLGQEGSGPEPPCPGRADEEEILILRARDPVQEVRSVCGQIQEGLRGGLRFRDMAVITGDLPAYGREIRRQFEAQKVPYFLDDKKSILSDPLVELIRSALETVRLDFPYESLFRCLKTGLVLGGEVGEALGSEMGEVLSSETGELLSGGTGEVLSEGTDEGPSGRTDEGPAEGKDEGPSERADEGPAEGTDDRLSGEPGAGWQEGSKEQQALLQEGLDRLENYVKALGIRGFKRWSSVWDRQYQGARALDMEAINRLRQAVCDVFSPLREGMGKGGTGASRTAVLRAILERLSLEEKLQAKADRLMAEGLSALAKEYSQVYQLTMELFDRLEALLGDEPMSLQEYAQILDAGFAQIKVGTIPATVDRVVVGDITRTRLDAVKVLYLVGANEGVIPQRKETRGLLTDEERGFFASQQVELAPTARENGLMQHFYLYRMLTKPSRQLVVTYAAFSGSGKELEPSPLIRELKELFPEGLKVREAGKAQGALLPYSEEEALRLLAEGLRGYRDDRASLSRRGERESRDGRSGQEDQSRQKGRSGQEDQSRQEDQSGQEDQSRQEGQSGQGYPESLEEQAGTAADPCQEAAAREAALKELFAYLRRHPRLREQAGQLVEAYGYAYKERGIGRAAARALYGNILQGSVTRLELYAACAYSHFLRYGLELMERQEYELGAVDMGNLFHQSLDLCFRSMTDQGMELTRLTEDQRKALVAESVAKVTEDYGNTILHSSFRNAYLIRKLSRITERTMWALGEQLKKGDLKPAGFEVAFSAADGLESMKIGLSEDEALHLRGRIDRMDLYEDETHVYVKIIDYKSGSASFDLAALYYGLQLQLVIYMGAALEMEKRRHPDKEVVPAGLFYYHIQDPMVEKKGAMTPEEIEAQIKEQLKLDGLVNSDLEVISRLDREIEGASDVIPVAIKSGMVQEARSSVASGRRFKLLADYVRSRCQKTGQEILQGDIGLRPMKRGERTGCDYCPYHAVCGFDRKTAGYGYRRLKNMKPEEIWAEIIPEGEADEEPEERAEEMEKRPGISGKGAAGQAEEERTRMGQAGETGARVGRTEEARPDRKEGV